MNKMKNIVAKWEIACFEQFLLLSLCFQKAVCCRGSESVYMRERVKTQILSAKEGKRSHYYYFYSLWYDQTQDLQQARRKLWPLHHRGSPEPLSHRESELHRGIVYSIMYIKQTTCDQDLYIMSYFDSPWFQLFNPSPIQILFDASADDIW